MASNTVTKIDATERSTLRVSIAFATEGGVAQTPAAATWTLTDLAGTVINNRENVTIGSLASSVAVYLQGADLQIVDQANPFEWRIFTVRWTDTNGRAVVDSIRFRVLNEKAVT